MDNNKFVIGDICLESYPCQHKVIINGKETMMSGLSIYNYCIKNKIEVPKHFKEYENYIDISSHFK